MRRTIHKEVHELTVRGVTRRRRASLLVLAWALALSVGSTAFVEDNEDRADINRRDANTLVQAPSPKGASLPPSAFAALRWRSVGPNRGGRSIAVSGVRQRPNEYYFGATGGGLWKTENGGLSWLPVGDGQFRSSSVGAIEVCEADPDVVYIGFGEVQLRGDIVAGDGIYKTTDGGRTWMHLGLESETGQQMVGRIRTHPADCNLVYAAVLGDAFGPSKQRGVYRSRDGGRTWQNVLFRSDRAGAVDLALARSNPSTLYAGFWEAYRKPWTLSSGGEGSGLLKSTDGGDTWIELTRNPGLPVKLWGKVAVSVAGVDPNRVYANIEAHDGGFFVSDDGGATWTLTSADRNLRTRGFYYTRVTADPQNRDGVYVNNENFWHSTDGGRTWERIPVPHEDNHDLWIDPANNRRMIQGNDGGANVSLDGGRTWTGQNYPTAQMYTLKPTGHFPYHICGAQQDQGTTACVPSDGDGSYYYQAGLGESGWVVPDPDDPETYYASAQFGQLVRYNRTNGQYKSISPYPVRGVGKSAGDLKERFQWTFPVAVSPGKPRVLYTASQHLWRSMDRGDTWTRISPDLTYADPATLGPSGGPITLDRTTVEHYATIFSIAPSAHAPEVIWVGSDDGLIHVTRDAGQNWQNVTPSGLPKFSRVSTLESSPHRPGKAYAAVTRYRMQDVQPYIWKTEDYGQTWTNTVAGIRLGDHVRTVVEDPVREGLLFAGTENGVYVSLNDGRSWQSLQLNLPVSPVYALATAGNDLVAATHGRAFWILDDVTPLRQLTSDVVAKTAHLFRPATAFRSRARVTEPYTRTKAISAANIYYHLAAPALEVRLEILNSRQEVMQEIIRRSGDAQKPARRAARAPSPGRPALDAGLNVVTWDLKCPGVTTFAGLMMRFSSGEGPTVPPGTYHVRLTVDGKSVATEPLAVLKDPRLTEVTQVDFDEQFRLALAIRDKTSEAHQAVIRIRELRRQVDERLAKTEDKAIHQAATALKAALGKVEGDIYEVRLEAPEDQLNFGLRINNDLAVLQLEVETGDGRPSPQHAEVFEELSQQLDAKLRPLREALANELPGLNRLLQGASLERVR